MIVMALKCVDDSRYLSAIQAAETYIRNHKGAFGSFGNEYTTGLAIQVGSVENEVDAIVILWPVIIRCWFNKDV